MEPELERAVGERAAGGETVNEAGERALGVFFAQNPGGVRVRFAGVHDQRQAGFAGRGDVDAETRLLSLPRAVLVVIVEPGFAKAHDLGMAGQAHQVFGRDLGFAGRLVGMDADRAKDIVMGLGHGQHPVEPGDMGADGQHPADPGVAGADDHLVQFVGEIRKIQVAVAVDQGHEAASASASA